MIVSWKWLQDYVDINVSAEELVDRLSLAGLNHEGTEAVGDDFAIDLEVTSNRPDWLGHIGVAREIAVLLNSPLTLPELKPTGGAGGVLPKIGIHSPRLCRRYTARSITGCKVAPSPQWLQDRLTTLGIACVNNIVDATNYVMMECGQPLHAFDAAQIQGSEIVVRCANKGEQFVAIDHKTYELDPSMCVIGDANRAVALGGVMGGAESEVSEGTTDVLLEAADFDPVTIRNTARALNLYSPSSYRFERGVDPAGVDWASLRCSQLIAELAGGEVGEGIADDTPTPYAARGPVTLRFSQLKRILGIDIPIDRVTEILVRLGNEQIELSQQLIRVSAPSWRQDLTREADLIEEVARIHGYDKIPEDVGVNMVSSSRRSIDRVMQHVRTVTAAVGFDEAMTCSVVSEPLSESFSPWTDSPSLRVQTPMLRGASCLRRSLIPSLLEARRINESLSNPSAELFEVAKIYIPREGDLPTEPLMMSLVSGRDFHGLKGAVVAILDRLHVTEELVTVACELPLCLVGATAELKLGDASLGYIGQLSADGRKAFKLRNETCICEVQLDVIAQLATLIPQYVPKSAFPAMARDLNLVLEERVRWDDIARTVQAACGPTLDGLEYLQTYRDTEQDGDGKKRLLFRFQLRADDRTLTSEEADEVAGNVVRACEQAHGARVLS